MSGVRFSLFTKIIIWFFLNLLVLAAILFAFFSCNFRYRPNSSFASLFGSNVETVTREITNEIDDKTRERRDEILKNYSAKHSGVEFFLFDSKGEQLGGGQIELPAEAVWGLQSSKPALKPAAAERMRKSLAERFCRGNFAEILNLRFAI